MHFIYLVNNYSFLKTNKNLNFQYIYIIFLKTFKFIVNII